MTNEEVLARFANEYQAFNRISPARRREQLKVLLEFAGKVQISGGSIVDADYQDLQGLASGWIESGLHVNTCRKRLNMIRPYVSWAYAAGLISADSYLRLKAVKDPRGATGISRPRPYSKAETEALWAALDERWHLLPTSGLRSRAISRWLAGTGPWWKVHQHAMRLQLEAMIRLGLDMGLRRHEIYNLKVDDLHYDNEYLVIYGKADPSTGEKKARQVPMTDDARAAIKAWLDFRWMMNATHDSTWLSCVGGNRRSPMNWSRFQSLLGASLGGDFSEWHRLRHTCATNWLRAGAPLETVKELLGHSNLQQTLAYAKILPSDVQRQLGLIQDRLSELNAREEANDVAA